MPSRQSSAASCRRRRVCSTAAAQFREIEARAARGDSPGVERDLPRGPRQDQAADLSRSYLTPPNAESGLRSSEESQSMHGQVWITAHLPCTLQPHRERPCSASRSECDLCFLEAKLGCLKLHHTQVSSLSLWAGLQAASLNHQSSLAQPATC